MAVKEGSGGLDKLCAEVSHLHTNVDSRTIRNDVPALLENLLACGLVISKTITCDD